MIKHCEKCGEEFVTYPSIIKLGKAKFCSRPCANGEKIKRFCQICNKEFFIDPNRENDNKRGKFCSMPCYRVSRKGKSPWNKGKPAPWAVGNKYRLGKTNPNPHRMFGENNLKWLGDKVGYRGLHTWVERNLGKPMKCDFCGIVTLNQYHWANKSGLYLRDVSDWIRLCPKCHKDYDRKY